MNIRFLTIFISTLIFITIIGYGYKTFFYKKSTGKENFLFYNKRTISEKHAYERYMNTSDIPKNYYRINDSLKTNQDSLPLIQTIHEVIKLFQGLFTKSTYADATILFFQTLNRSDENLKHLHNKRKWPKNIHFINSIYGIDLIVSKSHFAYIMRDTICTSDSSQKNNKCIPDSYVVHSKNELQKLIHNFDPNSLYILKKNIQRQQGFFISSKLDEILKKIKQDKSYVICQKFLNDPYKINDHKINLRVYLLIVIDDLKSPNTHLPLIDISRVLKKVESGTNVSHLFKKECDSNVKFYMYTNGFIYYTPQKYIEKHDKLENIITSGYIDRKIYDENPMTFDELQLYMGSDKYTSLMKSIYNQLLQVYDKYAKVIGNLNKNIPGCKFSLFGCDIAPDKNLNVKILEINKGPDISFKDERDKKVKFNLLKDIFTLVGLVPNTNKFDSSPNEFIEISRKKNV